jgi:hypothetical protein
VFVIGQNGADGWGAYSCDPGRKCNPTKLSVGSKMAKRLAERYRRACTDPATLWFPSRDGVCAGIPMTRAPEVPSAPAPGKAGPGKLVPSGSLTDQPWPAKQ